MDSTSVKHFGHTYSAIYVSGNSNAHNGDIHGDVTNNHTHIHNVYITATDSLWGLRTSNAVLHAQLSKNVDDSTQDHTILDDIISEVATSNAILQTFEQHLAHLDVSPGGAVSIGVEPVVTLLTNAVFLFDDLRSISGKWQSDGKVEAEQSRYEDILDKLRAHNAAWKLQIDLLDQKHILSGRRTPEKDLFRTNSDAAPLRVAFEDAIQSLLQKNTDLQERMDHFQQQFGNISTPIESDDQSIREPLASTSTAACHIESAALGPTLLDDLHRSWVYRRNEHRSEVMSIDTSKERDDAWSEMSKLTFANASILSVIALPIRISELEHGSWYYQTAATGVVATSLAPIAEDPESDAVSIVSAEEAAKWSVRPARKPDSRLRYDGQWKTATRRMAGRDSVERTVCAVLSANDIRRFKWAWGNFDPYGVGYIAKELLPKLFGKLSGLLATNLRIYNGKTTITALLSASRTRSPDKNWRYLSSVQLHADLVDHPAKDTYGLNLEKLNHLVGSINVRLIRARRERLKRAWEELMVSADPERGVSFWSVLLLLACNADTEGRIEMTPSQKERQTIRRQKVEQNLQWQSAIGLVETLYWSRRFRAMMACKAATVKRSPESSIPDSLHQIKW